GQLPDDATDRRNGDDVVRCSAGGGDPDQRAGRRHADGLGLAMAGTDRRCSARDARAGCPTRRRRRSGSVEGGPGAAPEGIT
ncbi:hypothetical protein DQE84_18625, partial [Staphylococcus warneri]